jgi:phospholipid transport system substrate-binding protein
VHFRICQESPDALIKKVTDEVLTIVRQDKDIQNGNTKKAIELVEVKVLPHFNFQRMTALAMGRDWKKATGEQKKLSQEFKTLLVRTYSNALTGYKDQTIRYKPTKMQSGDTEVVVKTEVVQPGCRADPVGLFGRKAGRRLEGFRRGRGRRQPGDQLPRHVQPGSAGEWR